jgi:hypothetical protein
MLYKDLLSLEKKVGQKWLTVGDIEEKWNPDNKKK